MRTTLLVSLCCASMAFAGEKARKHSNRADEIASDWMCAAEQERAEALAEICERTEIWADRRSAGLGGAS
jgi:hypothetical protein